MMEDKYSLILKARAQLDGLSKLVVDQEEIGMSGWELFCLLEPVERQLTQALELCGGNSGPGSMRSSMKNPDMNLPFGKSNSGKV